MLLAIISYNNDPYKILKQDDADAATKQVVEISERTGVLIMLFNYISTCYPICACMYSKQLVDWKRLTYPGAAERRI